MSSCAVLQIQEDQRKLQQLEADYHAGNVSKKDYKREKNRLEREIKENVDLMNTPPPAMEEQGPVDDGGQMDNGDGGMAPDDNVGEDTGGDPSYVCENVCYYEIQGGYYYIEHGQRHTVRRLPAGGHKWSNRDGKPHQHASGNPRKSGAQNPQQQSHPQNGQHPVAAKSQPAPAPQNSKNKKDKTQ